MTADTGPCILVRSTSTMLHVLYICRSMIYRSLAVKRPAPVRRAPLERFAARSAAARGASRRRPHVQRGPHARGVWPRLPNVAHPLAWVKVRTTSARSAPRPAARAFRWLGAHRGPVCTARCLVPGWRLLIIVSVSCLPCPPGVTAGAAVHLVARLGRPPLLPRFAPRSAVPDSARGVAGAGYRRARRRERRDAPAAAAFLAPAGVLHAVCKRACVMLMVVARCSSSCRRRSSTPRSP